MPQHTATHYATYCNQLCQTTPHKHIAPLRHTTPLKSPPHTPLFPTPHQTTAHHTTLIYTTPHHTNRHYTTLHYTTPHNTTPHHTINRMLQHLLSSKDSKDGGSTISVLWNMRDNVKYVQNRMAWILDLLESVKNIFTWVVPYKVRIFIFSALIKKK